jgi:hypothetical protein
MARVVVVGYEHVDPLGEIVSLSDEETKGDWREWVSRRIDIPLDQVQPLPTIVPGVSLVVKTTVGRMGEMSNTAACRLIYGQGGRSLYEELSIGYDYYGLAVALIENPDFDNKLKHIGGTQRVAVELAADAEWGVLRRIVARINEGPVRWPPHNPSVRRP